MTPQSVIEWYWPLAAGFVGGLLGQVLLYLFERSRNGGTR